MIYRIPTTRGLTTKITARIPRVRRKARQNFTEILALDVTVVRDRIRMGKISWQVRQHITGKLKQNLMILMSWDSKVAKTSP